MGAKKITLVSKLIDLPSGHWQLFSYGQLTSVPTAKQAIWIRAFFRRVQLDKAGEIVSWTKEVTVKDLPVGEMVGWQVGCIFDSVSKRVYAAQAIGEKIRRENKLPVEFGADNCRLIRRFEPLSENSDDVLFGNRGVPRGTRDADVYFLLVDRGSELPLLIPCTTIVQTFWSCSSNFLHMLLDSRFIDFDRYVVNVARSYFDEESRSARLWLRQWSLDDDARFLASIAFSPLAVQRGKNISARLHSTVADYPGQSVDRYLAAWPPYTDPMKLDADVMPVQTALGKYLYVQRIVKSTYQPPFNDLVFDRDNDGRPQLPSVDENGVLIPLDTSNKKAIDRPRIYTQRNEAISEYSLTQDHPDYKKLAKPLGVGQFENVFSNLAAVEPKKLKQLELNFESGSNPYWPGDQRWTDLISTLPSSSQSSVKALGAVLVSGRLIAETADTGKSPVGKYLNGFIDEYWTGLRMHFEKHRPTNVEKVTVTPVFPWKPNWLYDGQLTFSLPSEVDDYRWAHLYADPDTTIRKRAVCLKVTFSAANELKTAYILDIEGRQPKKRGSSNEVISGPPMLFFWRDLSEEDYPNSGAGNSFSPKFLQDIVLNLVGQRGDKTIEYLQSRGVIAATRNHSESGVPLKRLFAEVFALL